MIVAKSWLSCHDLHLPTHSSVSDAKKEMWQYRDVHFSMYTLVCSGNDNPKRQYFRSRDQQWIDCDWHWVEMQHCERIWLFCVCIQIRIFWFSCPRVELWTSIHSEVRSDRCNSTPKCKVHVCTWTHKLSFFWHFWDPKSWSYRSLLLTRSCSEARDSTWLPYTKDSNSFSHLAVNYRTKSVHDPYWIEELSNYPVQPVIDIVNDDEEEEEETFLKGEKYRMWTYLYNVENIMQHINCSTSVSKRNDETTRRRIKWSLKIYCERTYCYS